MAKCDLCGQDAGFLKKRHKECQARFDAGCASIKTLAANAALEGWPPPSFLAEVRQIASDSFIPDTKITDLLVAGFDLAVESALEDDGLSEAEENALDSFAETLDLSQEQLDTNGSLTKAAKSAVIREVLAGRIAQRIIIEGTLPFNFQKNEILVWVFQDVKYFESRTTTLYHGSYQGVSVRVAKGLYYRTGGFKGNPIPTTQIVQVDAGVLAVTNKHIYFAGAKKPFRVAYNKMMAITPYSDGIAIQRDANTARPQTFLTEDGWFTYNLVANLAKLAAM